MCSICYSLVGIFISRPIIRLTIGGIFFFLEILGLYFIFNFWHPFWIPLAFLSVDWEWLYKKYQHSNIKHRIERIRGIAQSKLEPSDKYLAKPKIAPSKQYKTILCILLACFFGYYLITIFTKIDQVELNYPFSAMGFFSDVKASKPYGKHLYWPYYRGIIQVVPKGAHHTIEFKDTVYDEMWRDHNPSSLKEDLKAIKYVLASNRKSKHSNLRNIHGPITHPHFIGLYKAIAEVPPYPLSPKPVIAHEGLKAMLLNNKFYAASGALEWHPRSL